MVSVHAFHRSKTTDEADNLRIGPNEDKLGFAWELFPKTEAKPLFAITLPAVFFFPAEEFAPLFFLFSSLYFRGNTFIIFSSFLSR